MKMINIATYKWGTTVEQLRILSINAEDTVLQNKLKIKTKLEKKKVRKR